MNLDRLDGLDAGDSKHAITKVMWRDRDGEQVVGMLAEVRKS